MNQKIIYPPFIAAFLLTGCTTTVSGESGQVTQKETEIQIDENGLVTNLHVESVETGNELYGFALYVSDFNFGDRFYSSLPEGYGRVISNWFAQDMNSLYIRFYGDSSTYWDFTYGDLWPGIDDNESNINRNQLERLTNEHGIIYWMDYPSRLWVSAKDQETFWRAYESNSTLRDLIDRLAYNPYEAGSWYNLAGRALDYDYSEWNAFRAQYTVETGERNYSDFGIDYSNPALYLESGPRTTLSEENLEWIRTELGEVPHTKEGAWEVMHWVVENIPSGGPDEYRMDINDYMALGKIKSCGEQAMFLAASLRAVGIPAIHVAGWDMDFVRDMDPDGTIHSQHEFVEAYVEGQWVILDGYNFINASEYDPANPDIIMIDPDNSADRWELFVFAKGLDNWDFGRFSHEAYGQQSDEFVRDYFGGRLDEYLSSPQELAMYRP